jgi:hypothetical protein
MTTTDKWLLERAAKKKREMAQLAAGANTLKSGGYAATFDAGIDGLWTELQAELRRQIGVYNEAAGQPDAVVATMDATSVGVRSGGRSLTITVDRKHRALTERFDNGTGAVRSGRPRIGFRAGPDDRLSFSFGVVRSAAASILRRVID